ncbi:MAG TPA: hypothetical protein VFY56_01895 [Propionibacteriaceae bacterium]|nr:hypothetical protein [Propionibacteriaceae bacterium]
MINIAATAASKITVVPTTASSLADQVLKWPWVWRDPGGLSQSLQKPRRLSDTQRLSSVVVIG